MSAILAVLRGIWAKEPALVLSGLTAVVVFVCAKTGIVVPEQTIANAIAYVIPILLGGAAIRGNVTPAA